MDKYQQQQEPDAEASTHQERFEEINNTVHIDIPDRTKFSPDGKLGSLGEMKTSSSSIDSGFTATILESYGREYLLTSSKDMKHTSKRLPTGTVLYAETPPRMSAPPLEHTVIHEMETAVLDMKYRSEMHSREMLIEESSSKIEADYGKDSAVLDMMYRSEMHSRETLIEESPSKIETDATQAQATRYIVGVQEHGKDKNPTMQKDAYLLVKEGIAQGSAWWERVTNETGIFQQKSPLGNTVLHMAAANYGNSACWVGTVAEKAPQLLTAKNSNDNMALHVAAAAGNIRFLRNLLFDAHLRNVNFSDPECLQKALNEILTKNKLGNTFIHEALLNGHKDVMHFLSLKEDTPLASAYKEMVALAASFQTNNQNKSILYLAIEAGYKEAAGEILTKLANPALLCELIEGYPGFDKVIPHNLDPNVPAGKSPLLAAIMKQDREILDLILKKKPSWVTLRDTGGRTPLHYAASIGYLYGVQYLLNECSSCATERDNHGYFPLHLASDGGHVEVVKELLKPKYCLDPRELLDNGGRNFVHLAVASGKFSVVRFLLKSADNELGEMINDQDANGNSPLHLATLRCHPKIVQALTWDKRVKLTLVNEMNQTALDVCTQTSLQNPSLRQRLTWLALKSAGVPYADPLPSSIKIPSQSTENLWKKGAPNMDQYKDRINTLILVSTLIITVTFAAGFTLPGGAKSSDPGQGMALMLHRMLFKLFIFCITISMYGAISVTIILIWAQLGDLTMAILALNVAKYCLGAILATLSLAFLTGVHLVIRDLSWLATITLIMSITFIIMLLLLYILLWLPSSSSKSIVRLISYYPFLMLASLVEGQ